MNRALYFLLGVILSLGVVGYYVIATINERVGSAFDVASHSYDAELLARIQLNDEMLLKAVANSKLYLDEIEETAIWINKIARKISKGNNLTRAESGVFSLNASTLPYLLAPDGCQANRGVLNQTIKFKHAFTEPPEVLVSFSRLDFGHGQDHRLKAKVTSISNDKFDVNFVTWCDTTMSQAEINWIAVGSPKI